MTFTLGSKINSGDGIELLAFWLAVFILSFSSQKGTPIIDIP